MREDDETSGAGPAAKIRKLPGHPIELVVAGLAITLLAGLFCLFLIVGIVTLFQVDPKASFYAFALAFCFLAPVIALVILAAPVFKRETTKTSHEQG